MLIKWETVQSSVVLPLTPRSLRSRRPSPSRGEGTGVGRHSLRFVLLEVFSVFLAMSPASSIVWAAEEQERVPPAGTSTDEELISVKALTDQLFKQIEHEKPDEIWDAVNRLVRLGRAHGSLITERLDRGLLSSDYKLQLACARALCQLNSTEQAAQVLSHLVEKGSTPEIRRLAANAIGLTTSLYGNAETTTVLVGALKNETDDWTRISIARSLWRIATLSEGQVGREALLKVLAGSREKNLKDEAALVLAENGLLRIAEVHNRLLNLYNEPTTQGERAFNLLRHDEENDVRANDPKMNQGEQLIRELLRTIRIAYPDESKCDLEKLFEDAAKGMVGGLDPFSQYMDRDDVKSTQELLQQDYGGIGAYVGLRNNSFIVTSPIYGSPADRAGLHALDIIQEVDGEKVAEMIEKDGINGVILKLKGSPGTPVKLKYFRRGFAKSLEVTIVRESIKVESVFSSLLPGDIGYVRLTRFGERSTAEMQAALDMLLKQQHAKAIIFDLRDNPGGLLRTGVEIADMFLQGEKLIVYSEGNKDFAPYHPYNAKGGPEDEAFPVVVLVGAGSASASEIVAGALQDHKRAILVGEKTFGKGSVQQIMPVRTTDRQTQLRLTVARYFLPTGRCIHEKGIEVDIEVKSPETHSWVIEKTLELRNQMLFDDHIRATWIENKDLYAKLAQCDDDCCENWPGFAPFYQSLHTNLEPNDIRAELRRTARRFVQDEQKKEMIYDLEVDVVLQRGVLEALKQINVDPGTISSYKSLPGKFNKKDELHEEGAMLPKDVNKNF